MIYLKYEKNTGFIQCVSTTEIFLMEEEKNDYATCQNEDFEFNDFVPYQNQYKVVDGALVKAVNLQFYRTVKSEEMSALCQEYITNGFDIEFDGETYHMSFDTEAQLNYQSAERALFNDLIDEVKFTATKDGEYCRVAIDKSKMEKISVAIINHKEKYIGYYRETLVPKIEQATTLEDIEAIKWELK